MAWNARSAVTSSGAPVPRMAKTIEAKGGVVNACEKLLLETMNLTTMVVSPDQLGQVDTW